MVVGKKDIKDIGR